MTKYWSLLYLASLTDILARLQVIRPGGQMVIRNFIVLTMLMLTTSAFANESGSISRMKSWTHANGNSAMLELVECKGEWVKFRKADGKIWTMPINNLAKADQEIIVDMYKGRDVRVSLPGQQDLDSVRASFEQLKTDEPDLYNRLNQIAEYPMDDYEVQVNDDGVYYLQFMLKQGAAVDNEAEALVASALNASNFGDPIKFELRQIPQQEDIMENEMGDSGSMDETMLSPPSPGMDESEKQVMDMDMSLSPGMSEMPMEMGMDLSIQPSGCGCMTAPVVSDVVYYSPCQTGTGCCNTSSCANCCQSQLDWSCGTVCYQDPCCNTDRRFFRRRFRLFGRLFGCR